MRDATVAVSRPIRREKHSWIMPRGQPREKRTCNMAAAWQGLQTGQLYCDTFCPTGRVWNAQPALAVKEAWNTTAVKMLALQGRVSGSSPFLCSASWFKPSLPHWACLVFLSLVWYVMPDSEAKDLGPSSNSATYKSCVTLATALHLSEPQPPLLFSGANTTCHACLWVFVLKWTTML